MKFLCTLFIALSCMSSASASDASIYTLYRTYVGKSDGREHLATFDNKAGKSVNQINCQSTADLWNKRDKSTKFWCELGRYKE
jgi:hypothetical protein